MANDAQDAQRIFSLQEKVFSLIDSRSERQYIAKAIIAASSAFHALEDQTGGATKAYCVLKGKVTGGWACFVSQNYTYVDFTSIFSCIGYDIPHTDAMSNRYDVLSPALNFVCNPAFSMLYSTRYF